MNPAQQIRYLDNLLESIDTPLRETAMEVASLQAEFDLGFAKEFTNGSGSVDNKKQQAVLTLSELHKELLLAQAKERYLQSRFRSLLSRQTAAQSLLRFESGRS